MYLILPFSSYWCQNELIEGSIFEFQTKYNIKRKGSRLVYVLIEGQNAKTTVEWAKCFLCQNNTIETLLSSEKLCAIFKNLAGFAAIGEVPSHFLRIKTIKKEDLKSTNKNYNLNILWLQYACTIAKQTQVLK